MINIMDAIMLGVMIYTIVMCSFMVGNMLTGFSIPWLYKTADKLSRIGIAILLVSVIAFFSVCAYGIATDDPSFVGVMEGGE